MNISKSLCEQLHKDPLANDDLINSKDIREFTLKGVNTLYIISIVVNKNYRGQGIASALVNKLKKFISKLISKGYVFDYIYGTAVTKVGCRLAIKNGFEIIKRVKLGVYFISLKVRKDAFYL